MVKWESMKGHILYYCAAILIIAGFTGLCFYRSLVVMDYATYFDLACDPGSEQCFVTRCNPLFESCTGDPDQDITYSKRYKKHAHQVTGCDREPESCDPWYQCSQSESCSEVTCTESGEECSQ